MGLISTLGAVNANSYVTSNEASLYFDDRMHSSTWDSFAQQDESLITASQMLDWFMNWKGYKTSTAQSMQWPRTSAIRSDGTEIDDDVLPSEVKIAVYELSLSSISADRLIDDPLAGISELKAASLMIKSGPERPNATNKRPLPAHIYKILSDLCVRGSGAGTVRLLRA